MTLRRGALALMLVLAAAGPCIAGPPGWVTEALAGPASPDKTAAVVLFDHEDVSVGSDGRIRTTKRYVVRIQDRAGRDAAVLREVYVTGTGKVRELRAWIIRANGQTRDLGNREALDVAAVNNDVYNEVRVRAISAVDDVAPGDVFAAEIESEDRVLFAQMEWRLQERWPVRISRRSLTLPAGGRVTTSVFNRAPVEPQRKGNTWTWEVRDLPEIAQEEWMPPATDVVPRLAVSFFGADTSPVAGQFERWEDVSAWLHALSAPVPATDPVAAKARELAAAATADFDKVKAIGSFAQRVQYVSIQTGIGRGGGYQPRAAALVFERNYGDCKDKANLMRAMLAAIGIKSHLVSIFSGDRNYVRPEWPSPQQFNHVILAVALATIPPHASSTLDHPQLGRLLLFDPTDEHTPLGELPLHEQGSLALIVGAPAGGLVRMPLAPASHHLVERTIEGTLDESGTLSATVREHSRGAAAIETRGMKLSLDAPAYRARVESRVHAVMPRARVTEMTGEPHAAGDGTFVSSMTIVAEAYAQRQASLFLVPAPLALGGRIVIPASRERSTPVRLDPSSERDTVKLKLPAGFVIDELPAGVSLDSPFGRYTITYTEMDRQLVVSRTLEIPLLTIRTEQFAAARTFFDKVRAADTAPTVLVRR